MQPVLKKWNSSHWHYLYLWKLTCPNKTIGLIVIVCRKYTSKNIFFQFQMQHLKSKWTSNFQSKCIQNKSCYNSPLFVVALSALLCLSESFYFGTKFVEIVRKGSRPETALIPSEKVRCSGKLQVYCQADVISSPVWPITSRRPSVSMA